MIPYRQAKGITFNEVSSGGTSLTYQSLEMHKLPSTLEYNVGDLLSFEGMELFALYTDGTDIYMKDVSDIATPSVAEGTAITEDMSEISFTYTDKGTTQRTSYDIIIHTTLKDKPIYNNGVYGYEDITGKYDVNQRGSGTSSLDGDYVQVTTTAASSTWTLIFNYAFDLTDISYIKIEAICNSFAGVNLSETNGSYSGGTKTRWATVNGSNVTNQTYGTKFSSQTAVSFVIDVRDMTGEYYVRAGCNYNYSQGLMKITKMWLE